MPRLSNQPPQIPSLESGHTVCAGCGCLCDDIEIRQSASGFKADTSKCQLGKEWFTVPTGEGPAALIEGKPTTVENAVAKAAEILLKARYPLVFGLETVTCEGAAKAVAIADWLGANLDTTASINQGPTGLAFQGVGEISCSLGEVRNRADLIIFWGADPDRTHPRHTERYSLSPSGIHIPNGRQGRYLVVVDSGDNLTAKKADLWIQPKSGKDFEILWTLRGLVQGPEVPGYDDRGTGVPLSVLKQLANRLVSAKFGVLFYGAALTSGVGHHLNVDAAVGLAHDINAHTRFYARPLRGAGNPTGSDSVTCWQTGYSFGVNLSREYPRFGPGEFTAPALLRKREADAALLVGVEPENYLGEAEKDHLANIPSVHVGNSNPTHSHLYTVVIRTAPLAIADEGTIYRMDDISLPLRPVAKSVLPTCESVLASLELAIISNIRHNLTRPPGGKS